jgi:DNA-binding transcriptional LysR family regulator
VVPTEAGHAFAKPAVRTLRSLEDAADSVGELTSLRSGVVALETFNAPAPWRLDELVSSFLSRHPHPGSRCDRSDRWGSFSSTALRRAWREYSPGAKRLNKGNEHPSAKEQHVRHEEAL